MRKKEKRINGIQGLLVCLLFCMVVKLPVSAEVFVTNEDTGYQVCIEDDAELLSEAERQELARQMVNITQYGNVMFKTIDENSGSTPGYARTLYSERFGSASGTLFLIDMDNRNIWIRNGGRISYMITDDYSDTITDNCYTYASRGDYYGCAQKAFSQIEAVLKGDRIAQPMKYICNAFLAVILSLLLTLGLVRLFSRHTAPSHGDLLRAAPHKFWLNDARATYTHTTKKYDPPSSDSSGSDSGGGGGGGGGGGDSGSGGGHSF